MLVIGGSEIAHYLAEVASTVDFQVFVCDPREEYKAAWRAKGARWVDGMPDDAVVAFRPDGHSVILTVSHDPKLDDMALMEALRSDAFYVGAVGSARTSAERRMRLAEFDLTPQQVARLRVQQYGPSHPEVATVHNNLAVVEQRRGRLEPAREHLQRALEVWTKTLGPEHPQIGVVHGNLGLVEKALGHRAAAIEHFEQELSFEAPPKRLADTKLELARLLWEDPATRVRARTLAEESAAGYGQAEALDDQAEVEAWLREHPLVAR